MSLIPYVTFSVTTTDPISVVARRLSEKIDRTSWFPGWTSNLPYTGDVWDNGFKVVPIISYRNSFLPIICGSFEPQASGTVVHVTMRIHWAVTVFLCVWCGIVGSAFIAIFGSVVAGEAFWGVLFFPLFMLLFAAGLTVGAFWWEMPQRREDITRVLLCPPALPHGLRL